MSKLSMHHDHGWLVVCDANEDAYIKIAKGLGTAQEKQLAHRLAVCWNAFDGLPTSQIESMVNVPEFFFKHMDLMDQRRELLKALQKVLQWIDDNCETTGFDSVEAQADAAIAKATKETP